MKRRQKQRLAIIAFVFVCLVGAVALTLNALQDNLLFFISPSEAASGAFDKTRAFRLGGMVAEGSVQRGNGLVVEFVVTDFVDSVAVRYEGILPDLFREGQGIVAHGKFQDSTFIASEVLAKHDENYMPPEVTEALEKAKR